MAMLMFTGIANASAAVALDARRFILADDERKFLSVFHLDRPEQKPVKLRIGDILDVDIDGEPDLEGAAEIGGTAFWISSHGTNDSGERSKARSMLFATRPRAGEGEPGLVGHGEIYRDLLKDIGRVPAYREVLGLPGSLTVAPKIPGGISIEGLAATPKGRLLIGFRNPLHEGKAVIAKMKNPLDVIHGERPDFAPPILIDLGERGIRSMERLGKGYLIVGGAIDRETDSRLFYWSGERHEPPAPLQYAFPDDFNPEAIFAIPGGDEFCILSDDGRFYKGGDQREGKPTFRALIVRQADLLGSAT